MKIIIICAIGILAISSTAQPVETPEPLWVVNGQIYNVYKSQLWHEMDGKIEKIQSDSVLVQTYKIEAITQSFDEIHRSIGMVDPAGGYHYEIGPDGIYHYETKTVDVGTKEVPGRNIVIRNYPANDGPAIGKKFHFYAMQVGTTNFNGQQLELWDLGTKPTDDDLRKLQAKNKEQQDAAQKLLAEQRQAAAERAAAVKKSADAKALKSNQDAAARGDSFGLMRMGERYRDGDGVEKDLIKARDYLQKAADAGSPTAKEELSQLPSQ